MHETTDHQLVCVELKTTIPKVAERYKIFRDFSFFNLEMFDRDMRMLNWQHIFYCQDIDAKGNILSNHILNLFDKHAPLVTRRISKPKAEWYTDCIKVMTEERNRRLSKYKHTKNENDWREYADMHNLVVDAVRREKKAYLLHVQKNGSSKRLWNTLQQMNVYSNNNPTLPDCFDGPNSINEYFIQSVERIDTKINDDTLNYYPTHRISGNPNSFYFSHVNENMVTDAMNSIKSNVAGSDGFNLFMVRLCHTEVVPHLTHIINECIKNSHFSLSWKTAVVVPLPKIRNPIKLSDTRPVSLLPIFSKIFEKILVSQIKSYVEARKIYPPTQSGFQKAHSTTTAMLQITDDILEACDTCRQASSVPPKISHGMSGPLAGIVLSVCISTSQYSLY
nr:unnamed protein product [Callosobruchus analis]